MRDEPREVSRAIGAVLAHVVKGFLFGIGFLAALWLFGALP